MFMTVARAGNETEEEKEEGRRERNGVSAMQGGRFTPFVFIPGRARFSGMPFGNVGPRIFQTVCRTVLEFENLE